MRGERMAQCMRCDPAAEPRGFCRHMADAVELAHRYWPQRVLTRKQPASRPALQPPCAEQREKLRRQHGMPILAAFAQLDTDQHPFGIDVADPQHGDLAAAQTGAVGDAERGLVLETGAGRGLDQAGDLLPSKNPRQLPRVVRAGQLMGEVGAPERDGEEEAQCRGLRIHLWWLGTLLDLCELEAADIVAVRGIGGAAEKSGKGLDMPDIVVLCLVAKAPDGHVRDHAAAKIADWLFARRRLRSGGWRCWNSQSSGRDARAVILCRSARWRDGAILAACSPPARAGSFHAPKRSFAAIGPVKRHGDHRPF